MDETYKVNSQILTLARLRHLEWMCAGHMAGISLSIGTGSGRAVFAEVQCANRLARPQLGGSRRLRVTAQGVSRKRPSGAYCGNKIMQRFDRLRTC